MAGIGFELRKLMRRDFTSVQRYLGRVQPFQRRNPPLSDVAEYWL